MSRPEKWQDDFVRIAAMAAEAGLTDCEIAETIGVSERTLNYWKKDHPELAQALRLGKDASDERVVRSLYHKAVGYSHDAVKIFNSEGSPLIVPYVEHYPPDTTAAIFWLKNRRRNEWRDKQEHEHTGADGGPIKTEDTALARWIALKLTGATQ